MRFLRLGSTLGLLSTLLVSACSVAPAAEDSQVGVVSQAIVKKDARKIYVNMMPFGLGKVGRLPEGRAHAQDRLNANARVAGG